MRIITAFLATLCLAAPAMAQRFDEHYAGSAPRSVSLGQITIGEELDEKTEEYGARDVERLIEEVREDMTRELRNAGVFDQNSAYRIHIVLEDARPNSPTIEQLSDSPGLSSQSFSIGGAELSAQIVSANGEVVAEYHYDWESRDITDAQTKTTWYDARRTIARFADRVAESLSENSNT